MVINLWLNNQKTDVNLKRTQMETPDKTIKNLVFQGGGVKGIAYVGAIEELHRLKKLDNVKRVAGTSAGAITACLLALRYTPKEIHEIVFHLNFASFEDRWNPIRILTKYGLYSGDAFLKWMSKKVGEKLHPKATFADFKANGCRDIKIFSTDLFTHSIQEFSFEETPNTIVAEAVRASMSIPLFFKAWKFSNKIPNDHLYVDGGVLLNFPIYAFAQNGVHIDHTLGLHLDDLSGQRSIDRIKNCHPLHFTKSLFDTLLMAQVVDFNNDPAEKRVTIRIDDFGISATNFGLKKAQKEALIKAGSDAVKNHFEGN